jgi:hypothetical protein
LSKKEIIKGQTRQAPRPKFQAYRAEFGEMQLMRRIDFAT